VARRINSRAAECLGAIHLAHDPDCFQSAPARDLIAAAAVLAKGLVTLPEGRGGGDEMHRGPVSALIDGAGRATG
jgi:hypothetical protein